MNVDLQMTAKPVNRGKQILKQLIGIALAAVFLWLAFRNTNFVDLWERMQHVDLWWMSVVFVITILSHWLRAWRWTLLLKPVADRKVGLWNSFCAVMIGYAVNIPVPRGGEVARVISITKSERLPWVGVLPTMLIDRLLDVAMLVFLLGLTLVMLPPDIRESISWLVPTGVGLCIATVAGLIALPVSGKILNWMTALPAVRTRMPDKVFDLVSRLSDQFDRGTRSLRDPLGLLGIALLSFAIWGAYFWSFYLGMLSMGMKNQVDVWHALTIFSIASVSVLVPTPGSLGTYHYAVSQAMQKISNIDAAQATAFATVFHAVTFVLAVCLVAAVCFIVQQANSKSTQE